MVGSVPTMINTALAQRRRRQLGLTQQDIADVCGVSRQAVSHWELGTWEPELRQLRAYAGVLGVSLDELAAEPEPEVAATP